MGRQPRLGFGEAVDIVLAVVGFAAVGWSVFSGLDELLDLATGTYRARTETDLDAAAGHLAEAIGILGIQAVLAVLLKGAPRTFRGKMKLRVEPAPPRGPGLRYSPSTTGTTARVAGSGMTSFYGDITYSTRAPLSEQQLVLLHEKVHQFLAPKLYLLREVRVQMRVIPMDGLRCGGTWRRRWPKPSRR